MEEASHSHERPPEDRSAHDELHPFVDQKDPDGHEDDEILDLGLLDDADVELLGDLEETLGGESTDDGGANLWDLILQDPSLFIEDELDEVSGQLMDTVVESRVTEQEETHSASDSAIEESVEMQPEALDDDSSSSTDARGDSSGMPDHPAPASTQEELEELKHHVAVDDEALPGAFPRDRVVAMMLRKRLIGVEQIEKARELAKDHPREVLWRVLSLVPGVDRDAVYATAATVYAFTEATIGDGKPNPDFVRLVMNTFPEEKRDRLLEMKVIPYEAEVGRAGSHRLIFVSHDPARPDVQRLLQELKVGRVEIRYAPESEIAGAIAELFPKENEYLQRMTEDPFAVDLGTNFDAEEDLIDEEALEAEISRSTLINLFEASLVEAVRQGASDVHIYPNPRRQVEIHFRVDGRLRKWHTEEKVHPEAFLAVVKDNSVNVDRFERDAAQDGFVQRRIDDALIRFRVSVLPIATERADVRAESIVIRVLDDRKVLTDLRKLGMLDVALDRFDKAIRQPHGMVILTGPTGSGKSTTLVAALHQVV
ncbi:MAG: ATPase, T2SS/T4P/T4SS family, partial [Rhodothermales bacterium]|nr:ATPase, T2SS/T4P/T4SS family [Rhodothermales bacterium]